MAPDDIHYPVESIESPPSTHNQPPSDLDILRERLAEVEPLLVAQLAVELAVGRLPEMTQALSVKLDQHDAIVARYDAERPVLEDDDHLAKAANAVKAFKATKTEIDALFKPTKEPFLSGGRAVDGHFNALRARITACISPIETRINVYYQKKEAERRAEEDRTRKANEEAQAALRAAAAAAAAGDGGQMAEAVAKVAEAEAAVKEAAAPTKVRSDHGAVVSGRKTQELVIVDKAAAMAARPDLFILDEKRAKMLLKAGEKIDGLELTNSVKAAVR